MPSPEQRETIDRWWVVRILIRVEETLLTLVLSAIIVLACYQILLRWLTQGGLLWLDPLLRYLVLWGGLLGAALATARDHHISMDVVGYLLNDRAARWLRLLTNLFSTVVAFFLVRATFLFIRSEYEFGGSGLFLLPTWIWNLIFPLAFTAIFLHFLLNVLQVGASLVKRGPTAS